MATRSRSMDSNTLLGAALGAITGAGGLGGLWALLGKRQDSDTKLLGQYYGDLNTRVTQLEQMVFSQQETIGILRGENAELKAENRHLQEEIVELRGENAQLRARVDGLAEGSEASSD